MNVKALLETTPLSDCTVETFTEQGLLNEVTWVCPSSELPLDKWIIPGVLIICVHNTFEKQKEIINAVGGDKISAVIHFGCVTEQYSPEEREGILSFYDSLDIPLIKATRRMSLINFSRHFNSLLDDTLDHEQDRMRWLRKLCTTSYSQALFEDRDRGIDPTYSYGCITISFKGTRYERDPVGEELAFSRIKDCLSMRLDLSNPEPLWFTYDGRLVFFAPSTEGETARSYKSRVTSAMDSARREVRHVKWRVSGGERVSSFRRFRDSYEHAIQTEHLIKALQINEDVSFYSDWYTHIQLLNQPREDLERQVEHSLGPILDKPDLIESLTNYLYFGENVKEAAELTYIHANTLKYRLGRIQELLDVDLKDPTVRFRLRIAVTIWRWLQG